MHVHTWIRTANAHHFQPAQWPLATERILRQGIHIQVHFLSHQEPRHDSYKRYCQGVSRYVRLHKGAVVHQHPPEFQHTRFRRIFFFLLLSFRKSCHHRCQQLISTRDFELSFGGWRTEQASATQTCVHTTVSYLSYVRRRKEAMLGEAF